MSFSHTLHKLFWFCDQTILNLNPLSWCVPTFLTNIVEIWCWLPNIGKCPKYNRVFKPPLNVEHIYHLQCAMTVLINEIAWLKYKWLWLRLISLFFSILAKLFMFKLLWMKSQYSLLYRRAKVYLSHPSLVATMKLIQARPVSSSECLLLLLPLTATLHGMARTCTRRVQRLKKMRPTWLKTWQTKPDCSPCCFGFVQTSPEGNLSLEISCLAGSQCLRTSYKSLKVFNQMSLVVLKPWAVL